MNAVLCGMMGSGKTAVAAAYSRMYNVKAVDTDAVIEERYGKINTIFETRGEQYFRDLETAVCKEVAQSDGMIISLGGGCVLRGENVLALRRTGKIFYLRARAETIIERLKGDSTRPLLKGGLEERVNKILSERAAVYESAADFAIDTDALTPEGIAELIRAELLR